MRNLSLFAIALLAAGASTASASNLTVTAGSYVPSSVQIPIPNGADIALDGPITYGNYTWSSTNFNSVIGSTAGMGFGANGSWDSAVGPIIGLNDSTAIDGSTDTMTIAFTTPVTEFGDYFNYVPNSGNPTPISVYDTVGNLIGTYDLTFATSGAVDSGEWLDFSSTTPIGSVTLTDNYVAISAPTPEPSSFVLLGSGLLAAAGVARRRLGR